ncbi:MAG: hypothetical protein ACP5GX_12240, partial [Anaerolineae bacterium]
ERTSEPQAPKKRFRFSLPVKPFVDALLPKPVAGGRARRQRSVPEEKTAVVGGLALGFLLVVALITITALQQFGGAERTQLLLEEAQETNQEARQTQSEQDWQEALSSAEQVLTLAPENAEAQVLAEEARLALDALQHAALLTAAPLVELGTSPTPRRILVAQSWLYVLNPAQDSIFGVPLAEDGITPASSAPTPILKRGQTISSEAVGHLVDMTWMEPGPGYPDGAILIYSDNGYLYIYEPSLGPMSITFQRLQGLTELDTVTLIDTYGEQFYLINRHKNQVMKYVPVNGIYDSPPRPYFAPEVAPQLQTALDMALDGRLYLLLGTGELRAYINGTEDLSFNVQNLPDPDFQPTVMAMEFHPEEGRIFLGDPISERIFVLNKRGEFQYQYRLPGSTLKQLEVLTVSQEPAVIYFVAENRIYAAPIPLTPQTD